MISALIVGACAWAGLSLAVAFALGRMLRPRPTPAEWSCPDDLAGLWAELEQAR